MKSLTKLCCFIIILFCFFTACKKTDTTPTPPPYNPPVTDTTRNPGTDTTKTNPDTTTTPQEKIDTVIVATPSATVITTRSIDSVVLEFGNLFSFDIRLESYTGDDVTAIFHPKGTMKVKEDNVAIPIYDQDLFFSDTPVKSVLDSLTLKDTVYTHWELYNKPEKKLVYVVLVYDKQFVGSPEVIYRLGNRSATDGEVTPEQLKTAIEKNEYSILNWKFF